jgi:hypothetical protein
MALFRSDVRIAAEFRARCSHQYVSVVEDLGLGEGWVVPEPYRGPMIRVCRKCCDLDPRCVKTIYSEMESLEKSLDDKRARLRELRVRDDTIAKQAPLPNDELGRRISNQRKRLEILADEVLALKLQLWRTELEETPT